MISISFFGPVQETIPGPIKYVIFINPLFDIENMTSFADNNWAFVEDKSKAIIVTKMKQN